jgi:hypothetical protein
MSNGQKIRLWIAGACQLIGFVLLLATPTFDGDHTIYYSTQDGLTYETWSAVFLVAATVLASISLYHFMHTKEVSKEVPSQRIYND